MNNKNYLYLGSEFILGGDFRNKYLIEKVKPKEKLLYCCCFYLKNNFPIVDIFECGKAIDMFSENIATIDKKAIDIFKRKHKRRLNFQEIKYLYAFECIKDNFEKSEYDGLLNQIIYPKKDYIPNMIACGEDWLFKTLDNKKEYNKFKKIFKVKKEFAKEVEKYYNYYFDKMIRKVVYNKSIKI